MISKSRHALSRSNQQVNIKIRGAKQEEPQEEKKREKIQARMSAFRSVLVTGANRGIGLEFVKQFTKSPSCPIICATCRDPSKATVSQMQCGMKN